MLLVKQLQPDSPSELAYECYYNRQPVGKLRARMGQDGRLVAELSETSRRDAGRALVAKLERDAAANGLNGIVLLARDPAECAIFLPAGYEPIEAQSLRLFKSLLSAEPA